MTAPVRTRWGIEDSQYLAKSLLRGVGTRWDHTVGVARRAAALAPSVPAVDRPWLISAAWLHDVGYGPDAVDTGFHPLDGAALLSGMGCPTRLCSLVAHHSEASFVAGVRGLAAMVAEYPDERSAVTDALCYADQTTGPRGQFVPLERRMAEALRRHGPGSYQASIFAQRAPALRAAADRVSGRLFAAYRVQGVVSGQPAEARWPSPQTMLSQRAASFR